MATPTNIKTGLSPEYPLNFAQAENGFIYAMNGINPPLKWDGEDSATQDVGVEAPTGTPVLQGATTTTVTTLVTSSGGLNPRSIAVDETNEKIYVTYEDSAWNRIKSYDFDGGSATDVLLSANRPESIQLDVAQNLMYWTSSGGGGAGAGQVRRATLTGTNNTLLLGSRTTPRGLALDDQNGHLYWVEGGVIYRTNINGGDLTTIYSSATSGYSIAVDIANLHIYYGTTGGIIARISTDGTGGVNLVTGLGQIVGLKLDLLGLKIYAADFTNAKIYRMNLDGSNLETIYSPAGVYDMAFARESAYLFYVELTTDSVNRASLRTLAGTYTAYVRFIDGDGNPSALSPISNEITIASASSVEYSSVQAAASPVTKRQILRNTSGQNLVYYVDIETSDLTTTTWSSTKDDDTLAEGEAVALYDTDGSSLVSRFGLPPQDRVALAEHSSRLFAAGTLVYEGTCTITNGSAAVTGINTEFTTAMEGRVFRIKGQNTEYEIDEVSSATALTLTAVFAGTTGYYEFEVTSQPATRNLIYPSEVGPYFDGWNVLLGVEVGDPHDEVRALLSASSYLYVFQRNSTFRLTYQDTPDDGTAFLEFRRGAVNQRCLAQVGSDTYILDERGVYKFGGGGAEDISNAVQVLFRLRPVAPHIPRINWNQQRFFHSSVDLAEETVRWFVCLGDTYFPKHALCYCFGTEEWWIEEYPVYVSASVPLFGVPATPAVGSAANRILALVPGELDLVAHDAGTSRIRLTGATLTTASFLSTVAVPASTVGTSVSVVSGRGKGQTRLIVSISAGVMTVDRPWCIKPTNGSVIQIGGIVWSWRSKKLKRSEDSDSYMALQFVPLSEGSLDVRTYDDYATTPTIMAADYGEFPSDSDGVRTRKGSSDAEINLAISDGYAEWNRAEPSPVGTKSAGVLQVELRGVSSRDPLRLRSLEIGGAK